MKASEFRERSTSELKGLEQELARELWKARFDNYTNQLDNTSKIKRLRRNIACVKTILTERERLVQSRPSKE
jgi:large subunit ribosomal protein L29